MNILTKCKEYIQVLNELTKEIETEEEGKSQWELSENCEMNTDNLKRVLKEEFTLFTIRDFDIKEIQRITKGIGNDWHGCIYVTFKLTYTGRLTIPVIYNICKDKVTYDDLAEAIEKVVCEQMFEYIIEKEKTGLDKE